MIELTERDPAVLEAWIPQMAASYIEQRVAAGEPRAIAEAGSAQQFAQLFPDGKPAEGQHVMDVRRDGEIVGTLWMGRPFGNAEDTWYVFYVEIEPSHRGEGLGRAAMEAAERWTIEHGGKRIGLNVFGNNHVARALYDSLGYEVLGTSMAKWVDGGPS
jgi:ribosomal protein S18 acetylase RimI-like enzyme